MKLISYKIYTGKENMQIDSDLLDNAIQNNSTEPVFRLYGWSPRCISLGRNQKDNFLKDCKEDTVRRLTGGRALLHDDEITYSYVAPADDMSVIDSYKHISGILIDFFNTLGVELDFGGGKYNGGKYNRGKSNEGKDKEGKCRGGLSFDYCMLLSTGADVCYQGKKIIGSAQYRKQGYVLQHGSILFGYNKELLEALFNEEVKGITTVKEILPDMTKEKFVSLLESYIKQL